MGDRRRRLLVVLACMCAAASAVVGVSTVAATGPWRDHSIAASTPATTTAGATFERSRLTVRTETLRIYPLGDSITFGATPVSDTPGGYRGFTSAILDRGGVTHEMVGTSVANPPRLVRPEIQRHDGHNGYRIDQALANLDGIAGAYDDGGGHWVTGTAHRPALHPDVVLVHLGTNDIWRRYDPANTYDDHEPLDEPVERRRFVVAMTGRLRALIDRLHALRPGTTVIVSTVIPISTGTPADHAPAEYAREIRAMVDHLASSGRRVHLADAHARFLTAGAPTPGLLSHDGIHPTEAGYAVLGEVFAEAILRTR